MEIKKKSFFKYGGRIPGLPGMPMGEPLDDETIDSILKHGQEVRAENMKLLKRSYGHNFANVTELGKQTHKCMFIWEPFTSYDGVDPENENLLKRQVVTTRYEEGSARDCVPDTTYYIGTTHWYDEFGFEIRREVITTYSLEELSQLKGAMHYGTTIIRENGLIKIIDDSTREKTYFDTGAPILPDWDRELECVAYPTDIGIKFMPASEISEREQRIIEESIKDIKIRGKEKPISVDEPIDKEKIIKQFEQNSEYTKQFEHPNLPIWAGYIAKRKAKLESAIDNQIEQKKADEIKAPLEKKIRELEEQNRKLQNMLNKTLEFAQTVRNSPIGKIFFGKKAKEVLGDQEKDTKRLSDGR